VKTVIGLRQTATVWTAYLHTRRCYNNLSYQVDLWIVMLL